MIIDIFNKRDNNKKLLIADRDGTLNIDCGYPHKIKDLYLIETTIDILKLYKNKFQLAIVTNQSGIGRGYYTLNQARRFNEELVKRLELLNIIVTTIATCPHDPIEECNCRKPKPLMIYKSIEINNVQKSRTFMIGDKKSDLLAANSASVKYDDVKNKLTKLKEWIQQ
tara:strand:+ start:13305 stop:13808 length:504 start_codon:yes stop_codon:yes gene_type:complete